MLKAEEVCLIVKFVGMGTRLRWEIGLRTRTKKIESFT